MRANIMFGLNHVEADEQNEEVRRLLAELSKKIYTESSQLKAGDVLILRDINGNRVGVMDILEDRK